MNKPAISPDAKFWREAHNRALGIIHERGEVIAKLNLQLSYAKAMARRAYEVADAMLAEKAKR